MSLKKATIWQFDLLVYRLYSWRWNWRLEQDATLRKIFVDKMNQWEVDNKPDN